MDDLSTLFSLNNWPGHLSYVLIAISYWLTEIFWLRVVAVVGLALEIVYFLLSGGDLRTGIGWDLVFIMINLYQLSRLVQDRLSLRLPENDRALLRRALTGLNDWQIVRLLNAGALCDLPTGTRLAEENQALEKLYFLCAGRVGVTIGGRDVSELEEGNFVGEVAFLTERPATATVIAKTECRALAFDSDKLKRFFQNETEVAGLIYQLIGRELAHKIKLSNTLLAGEPRAIEGAAPSAAQSNPV
ncbi:cyclic nucleotide-binding domain-containing protein [Pseudorhodoplanes sp.]|uniref:cyclic nucleotide-binding domain-containing protein n=1 Tax=Pseudorhodoplanes sp. TaxID=1934341 RepID=UPI003D0BE2F1